MGMGISDIVKGVSGPISSELAEAIGKEFPHLADQVIQGMDASHVEELLGHLVEDSKTADPAPQPFADASVQTVLDATMKDLDPAALQHLADQIGGQIHEGQADGGAGAGAGADAASQWVTTVDGVSAVGDQIGHLQDHAVELMKSSSPADQLQGQTEMQQSNQLFEGMSRLLQQNSDMTKDAIDNLHAQVLDATPEAVASTGTDAGDSHLVAHADSTPVHDATDHTAPPAHDDAAADPSTTA